MKLVLDMNISPLCVPALGALGHEALHWMNLGSPSATDAEIMAWARDQGAVAITHDLDFSDILGASGARGPSVIQIRAQRLPVGELSALVAVAVHDFQAELALGALLTLDTNRRRVRLLPVHRAAKNGDDHDL